MQSEKIDLLIKALLVAQHECEAAKKDKSNPHFKSKYATLEAVQEVSREPLFKNKLILTQWPVTVEGVDYLETTLFHDSGQFLSGKIALNQKNRDPQGTGSAITYFRRYVQAAILRLDQEDDDGNAASKPVLKLEDGTRERHEGKPISEAQRKRMWAIAQASGWKHTDVPAIYKRYGYEHDHEISWIDYKTIVEEIEAGPRTSDKQPAKVRMNEPPPILDADGYPDF